MDRAMKRDTIPGLDERPPSEQMVDLHVLVMPAALWKDHLKSAENGVIPETISAGFIRVLPDTRIYDLRDEIESQLNDEGIIPNDFVFLKSVGSRVTRVRPKQEVQLKVKAFLHPLNEIFIMENTGDSQYSGVPFSGSSSLRSSRTLHHSSDTYRSDKSEFSPHKTIPPIQNGPDMYTSTSAQTEGYQKEEIVFKETPIRNEDFVPGAPGAITSTHLEGKRQLLSDRLSNDVNASLNIDGVSSDKLSIDTAADPHFVTLDCRSPKHLGDTVIPPISASPLEQTPDNHAPGAPQQFDTGEYLPPLSASPVHSTNNTPVRSHREAKYTSETNEDSGISEMEEVEKKKNMDYNIKKEEERRKAWEEERNKKIEDERKQREQEELDRLAEETKRLQEQKMEYEAKRRKEEERKLEEERLRLEEERNQEKERILEEERTRLEEERQKRDREELERRREAEERDRLQKDEEIERQKRAERDEDITIDQLREELNQARDGRQNLEIKREELVRRAKILQQKTQGRRNQARDMWKKRYFEEKKRTTPLEEKANKLRNELDSLHRRIMSQLETLRERDDGRKLKDNKPSHQSNLKIQATKIQHEIEDLQRRTENIKMKLTAEMKLRNQAETELRALRAELTQKKITMSLTRSQQSTALTAKHELTPQRSEGVLSHR